MDPDSTVNICVSLSIASTNMKGILKRPTRLGPNLILNSVSSVKINCPQCGTYVPINWIEKLDYPIQHSKTATPDMFLVPMSIPLTCEVEVCKHSFHANTPDKKVESRWNLYGDEAGRYIDTPLTKYSRFPLNFFTITLVFCHIDKQQKLKTDLLKLKQSIPNFDTSKPLHFYKIWGSKEFFPTIQEKLDFAFKLAKMIKGFQTDLMFFSISSCSKITDKNSQAEIINKQKHETFQVSLLTTLAVLRENDKSVRWIFDNVQDSTSCTKTEGWAEEIFWGLQYTRQFAWLTARSIVDKAEFVTPGSHYLLEIADFISFVIAREFDRSSRGEKVEISSSRLGQGFFCSRIGNGDYDSCDSIGLPKRRFYGFDE